MITSEGALGGSSAGFNNQSPAHRCNRTTKVNSNPPIVCGRSSPVKDANNDRFFSTIGLASLSEGFKFRPLLWLLNENIGTMIFLNIER